MTTETASNHTQAVREGEELDWDALHETLKSVIPALHTKPKISQFPAGNSNLTYRLEYKNEDLVVRRPPFGTKAKSAHSMIREYQIMTALKPVYPCVPETLYYSDDESIIGSEFYVMRKVEGQVIANEIPAQWGFSPQDNRRFCIAFWEKLIELHQLDYIAAGLKDFGKPQGYVERQVSGWNARYERALTADVSDFSDVRQWLLEQMPPESNRHSILHGDFRIDNIILAFDDPCDIRAVLDWEICALGDPLMDLGNALAYWVEAGDPDCLQALVMQPSAAPGMLSRREILDLYQQKTAIDTTDFTFYLVYGYFRNAVILQQIYYRYFHAQTQDQRFRYFGRIVQQLGEHCQNIIAVE